MKSYLVKEIKPDSFFSKIVYLDKKFILTTPEVPFSDELLSNLTKWSFSSVFSEGEPHKEYTSADNSSKTVNNSPNVSSQQPENEKLEKAKIYYANFLLYVENLFIRATISDELDYKGVTEKIREMVEYIKEDRRFLMRILKDNEPGADKNYLAAHSVRSSIIAVIIGSYLKLPNHKLYELGVAALLHEVGMLKLPSQIYLSQRPLTAPEQKAILTHPILGYTMLKSFDFPPAICLAALEHHERENATGYPRRLTGDKLSLYSKIISVACSYDALSSKRPHKEAKDGYTGMLELLKNEGKGYDDTVVKALVLSLSIYPIGLYVLLSNGKKAQVVDINPENPRFPIVQIFNEFTPDGKIKTIQTAQGEITIARPLTRAETAK
ncbi:MAG: HD-GYP domain-containing protein [Spirochaetes bacterium]|nr:HD-GYP domain-containing protein [Spirochaetota bacterium]